MLLLLGFNTLYRGTWLVFALVGLVSAVFFWHPRLSESRQTTPFLAFFGLIALALWMKSMGPSPLRMGQAMSNSLPFFLLILGLFSLAIVLFKASLIKPELRYAFLPALGFCLLGWAVVYFSGSGGGPDPMVAWLRNHFQISEETAHTATIAIRKTLHFTVYGSLAGIACSLADLRFDVKKAATFGFACALLFASFDEFRQTTSPGRTGSVWDIGLDMAGASCFLGLSVLLYRRRAQPFAPHIRSQD